MQHCRVRTSDVYFYFSLLLFLSYYNYQFQINNSFYVSNRDQNRCNIAESELVMFIFISHYYYFFLITIINFKSIFMVTLHNQIKLKLLYFSSKGKNTINYTPVTLYINNNI